MSNDETPWETVDADPYDATTRLVVPGGWLYRNSLWSGGTRVITVTFVPEPAAKPDDYARSLQELFERLEAKYGDK